MDTPGEKEKLPLLKAEEICRTGKKNGEGGETRRKIGSFSGKRGPESEHVPGILKKKKGQGRWGEKGERGNVPPVGCRDESKREDRETGRMGAGFDTKISKKVQS